MDENNSTSQASSSNPMKFIIPVLLVIAIGAGAFFMMQGGNKNASTETATNNETVETQPTRDPNLPEAMTADAPIVVDVAGSNFEFSVKEIKVKRGQTVTINFTNNEGTHDWVIDEFNAKTKELEEGEKESITFVADKAGTFEYYCSVMEHRKMGMVGNLIVE